MSYLIYHPRRCHSQLDGVTIYHDQTEGNQDPYVWNRQFLHTYCHISQMRPKPGDINFWVSGDTFPNFSELYCDLIFTVKDKIYWSTANAIDRGSDVVDSDESYQDHYRWHGQHYFKCRRRYTLKAEPDRSFQPQAQNGALLDIVPDLLQIGFTLAELRAGLKSGFSSKPMRIHSSKELELYQKIFERAATHLRGIDLQFLRQKYPSLGS